ncbi:MAG: outer membrane beta-barrel protein [Flavobacteriaceae bacterium]|nr:outer membrane beta-barrel protein [Flavobacteriaceae bacterium]
MDEKKNIDRLFQEKFKDYEISPDPSVWKNIEGQLMKKRKRRIIPLWLQIGGAAAILLLLVSTGFWVYNQNTNTIEQPNQIITDIDQPDQTEQKTPSSVKEDNIITYKAPETNQEENNITKTNQSRGHKTKSNNIANKFISKEKETKNSSKEQIAISKAQKDGINPQFEKLNKTDVTKITDVIKEKSNTKKTFIVQEETITKQENIKNDIQKEIEKRTEEVIIAENAINKWSVGSTIAPVYYNTLSSGSPIDLSLANNDKNSNGSVSYGLKVNYKLSDRLSLQSGINTLELGYSTENVTTLVSSSLLEGSNTNINTNIDDVSIVALSTISQNTDTFNQRSSFDVSGTLDQSLSYIEIPLEAKYNILQKKIGVNVIGGLSTYFLYENKVSITSFGKTSTLGEASNINSLNFSGNLGVDFDYDISKKLYINVSPMFKYQFNTFSKNSGGFKPYYLGVYTGLNFRF